MALFRNELHEEFGSWPLAYIAAGGAEYGEIRAVGAAVGGGNDDDFVAAWRALGDRLAEEAAGAAERGASSARDLYLRAAVAHGTSYRPIFGAPVDPRLTAAFTAQIAAFDAGLALGPRPVAPLRIPFDGHAMPAYFLPAEGEAGGRPGPLLILTNGYDATVTDMYFASAVAATRRGYHCLIFDGPGQGGMLYEQGVPIRADWETVVGAVVDFALALPLVDPSRIALSGWSLGGHLALRAASAEHRLAAVIADPGMWSITGGMREAAARIIPENMIDRALRGEVRMVDRLARTIIDQSPRLRWTFVQRGFWVHGVDDIGGYLRSASDFTLDGRVAGIRCPTLLTTAEGDDRAVTSGEVFEALTCPKTLLSFTAAEGAGDHCEMMNRSLANGRVLDWLDGVLGEV